MVYTQTIIRFRQLNLTFYGILKDTKTIIFTLENNAEV